MGENSASSEISASGSSNAGRCCPWGPIAALILLRLALGWHFFSEGTKKVTYDRTTGEIELNVPTAVVFGQAKGPLASFYRDQVPGFHNWEELLASPQSWEESTAADAAPPYESWQDQIESDWKAALTRFVQLPQLSKEQQAEAAEIFEQRQKMLTDTLAADEAAIAELRHEAWRLEQWQSEPGANDIPFRDERIAEKRAEVRSSARAVMAPIEGIQRGYFSDLYNLIPAEDRDSVDVDSVLADAKQKRFDQLNLAVTCLITAVGALLLAGLFTRLAAAGGIAFLLTVMATQPPWVAGASNPSFGYQLVELAALLVMIATAAGRFGGLDFFLSRRKD